MALRAAAASALLAAGALVSASGCEAIAGLDRYVVDDATTTSGSTGGGDGGGCNAGGSGRGECCTTADCPNGRQCSSGTCVDDCPSGKTSCTSGCVDLTSSQSNCGACDADCGAGTCEGGTCSLTLVAVADAHVSEDSATTNAGTAPTLDVRSEKNRNARAFVRFDVSGVPNGANVATAVLRLCTTAVPSSPRDYAVDRVLSSWTESGVTWASQPAAAGSPTATFTSPSSAGACASVPLDPDVAAWVGGAANDGWRVADVTEGVNPGKVLQLSSREDPSAGLRPSLALTYTP